MTELAGAGVRRLARRVLLACVLSACATAPLAAQASVIARMNVLPPLVTGSGVRPVEFGTVVPGTATAVTIASAADSTVAGAGYFRFTGITGARSAQLVFSWSANLVSSADGMTIPFSMNGSYGLHCYDRKTQLPVCVTFNPGSAGGTSGTVVATPPPPPGGNSGILRVYVGGALNPPASLSPGLYTTTISVTLTRL